MDKSKSTIGERIERFLSVSHPDPDIARRGRLFNILLLSTFAASVAGFGIGLIASIVNGWAHFDETLLVVICAAGALFVLILYWLNQSRSIRLAPVIFLLGMVILISLSDEPPYLVAGRSTMLYVLPIIMASMLLSPAASFLMATLAGGALFILGLTNNSLMGTEFSTMLVEIVIFFLFALVSWLSARSLEKALVDLRTVNAELDHRVADRTRDLAEALIRVQLESSKNQAVLESIADGVIVFDARGTATAVNPAMSRLLNLPSNQLVGYRVETLMAGVVNVNDQQAVLDQLKYQESAVRLPGLRVQWGKKTLSASFAPIQMEQELGRSTVAVFRDITREAELEHMKTMFVSMVSHELRTPLSAIMGYGEILQEQVHGSLNDRQLNVVARLIANTKRLLSLVNDLLDRARLEAGQLKLVIGPFAPAALLDDLLSVTGRMAQEKDLQLVTNIAPAMPSTLLGDSQRLLQILINLVTNAIKFTEQGSVTIKLDRPNNAHWILQVCDTGVGIPLDEQPYVFDMFHQVDHLATRKQGGAGLGLSIVKQLVTLMKGEITLNSTVGVGTTFTVILPLNSQIGGQA